MTTLHKVTELTKKLSLFLGAGLVGVFLLVILIQYVISLIPKKETPPTVTFGQLPSIQFPTNTLYKNFTYSINTLSGQLPALPDQTYVYKTTSPTIGLLSLQQAQDLIAHNNIPGNPVKISDTLYQWQQVNPPLAQVTYDIVSNNFNFTTNYLTDPTVAAAVNLPDQPGAITSAKGFFTNFTADFSDIDLSKTQTSLYAIQNGTLVPASSISTTQAIRVDFYQSDINTIPIYYPHYPHSLIYAIIASVNYPNSVAEAEYYHHAIVPNQNGTYPIKSVQQAFNELSQNKGYIANYNGARSNILIQNALLAYYSGETPQDYLMPIIVFQGNDNFYGYVSAVTDSWISK